MQVSIGIELLRRSNNRTVKHSDLARLKVILGYSFKDSELLKRALTHRSVDSFHNETLEFLGDSVLSAIAADYLFRRFPDATEGELSVMRSKIVNNHTALIRVAEKIDFSTFVRVDRSFAKSNHKAWNNLLANALEALLGAVYLDSGYTAAKAFFENHFLPVLDELNLSQHTNYKSLLQEHLQGKSLPIPTYETIGVEGAVHTPVFTVACRIDAFDGLLFHGKGKTVKEAEQVAAGQAYERLCK